MTTSPDFYNVFKSMFGLKFLGLFWTQPRSENSGKFSSTKMSLSYKIDCSDLDKHDEILNYFNKYSKKVDDNFFGTPMTVAPIYTPFLDNEEKINISEHGKQQLSIGSQIRSISLSDVQLYNWYNRDDKHTIHRQLMTVESIMTKTVVRSNGNKTFRGRLFYAIIPSSKKVVHFLLF